MIYVAWSYINCTTKFDSF